MNGIKKIQERIRQDSDAQIRQLLQEAEAQAAEITAQYEATAKEEYDRILAEGRQNAAVRVSRMESMAQLDARKLRLAARQALLQETFDTAQKKLNALSGQAYVDLLVKLTLRAVSTGHETLVFSETDRNTYGEKVVLAANEALEAQGRPAFLTLDQETGTFEGGLYIKDGNIETNCTFTALILDCKEQMAQEIAQILFD